MHKTMKNKLLLIITLSFSLTTVAQTPKWVKYQNREAFYPESSYLRGFSSEINYDNQSTIELLEKCKSNAKKTLSESIQVSIKSVTVSGVQNINTGTDAETHEYIKHSSVSCSNVNVVGLKSETYYDKRKKTAYAFTYVKITDLINYYKQKISTDLQKLKQMYSLAQDAKQAKQTQKALTKFFECIPKFREIEEAQSILAALNVRYEASLQTKQTIKLKSQLDKSINELQNSVSGNISDLAYSIVNGLSMQAVGLRGTISLSSFTYQDSKMGSPFSKRLYSELEKQLANNSKLDVASQNISVNNFNNSYNYIITGTYWEEGSNLKLIVILRNLKTAKIEASIESKISKEYCTSNSIKFLPENFILANSKNKIFNKNEIVGGDLQLEIWTNRGQDNLLYNENDTLRLYVRVNKECYLRCVYYLADNSSVLLLDNYYVGVDKVNKVYKIPDEFVCAEPFGVEVMQVNAQTDKFAPLITQEKYGYNFITENLGEIVKKTRGFKRIKNNEVSKAEKRLMITTMPM